MKKAVLLIVCGLIVIGLLAFFFAGPACLFLAKRILSKTAGFDVKVSRCRIDIFGKIDLYGIEIKEDDFLLQIKQTSIVYDFGSLSRSTIPLLRFYDALLVINSDRDVLEIYRALDLEKVKGLFLIKKIELAPLTLSIKSKDFDLQSVLSGEIEFDDDKENGGLLNGRFKSVGDGYLTIHNMDYLKRLARLSRQPEELFIKGFKDYHYDQASVMLFLDKADLTINLNLNGAAGSRELKVVLHDIKGGVR